MSPIDDQLKTEIIGSLSQVSQRKILNLSTFERIDGGIDTEIFAFDVIYDEKINKPEAMVIRIFSPNRVNQSVFEFNLQKTLYQKSIRVPKQLFINGDNSDLGRDYIIMERLQGANLKESIKMMSKDDFYSVLQKILLQLELLHDPELLKSLDQSLFDDAFMNTEEIIAYEIKKIQTLVTLDDLKELKPVVIWLQQNRDFIQAMKPCLIHGDLNPLNVLLSNDSEIYLIDWTFARIGDYRMDIAFLTVGLLVETSWDIITQVLEILAEKGLLLPDLKYFIILSHVHILGMIYSALVNPNDEKHDIGRKIFAFKPYVLEISRLVKEITNVSLPSLNVT